MATNLLAGSPVVAVQLAKSILTGDPRRRMGRGEEIQREVALPVRQFRHFRVLRREVGGEGERKQGIREEGKGV